MRFRKEVLDVLERLEKRISSVEQIQEALTTDFRHFCNKQMNLEGQLDKFYNEMQARTVTLNSDLHSAYDFITTEYITVDDCQERIDGVYNTVNEDIEYLYGKMAELCDSIQEVGQQCAEMRDLPCLR